MKKVFYSDISLFLWKISYDEEMKNKLTQKLDKYFKTIYYALIARSG